MLKCKKCKVWMRCPTDRNIGWCKIHDEYTDRYHTCTCTDVTKFYERIKNE